MDEDERSSSREDVSLCSASDIFFTSCRMPPGQQSAGRAVANTHAGFSIFHEPWWLNITARGDWDVVRSTRKGRVVGEMPYCFSRIGLWRVSGLPPLTRTLGPVIEPIGAKPAEEFRHRLSVAYELIDRLPDFHRFHQILDPRIEDAMAFQIREFSISHSYTFQITPDRTPGDVWSGMRPQTRNLIRSADARLVIRTIDEPREFVDFYEASQSERGRRNRYGRDLMMNLTRAFLQRNAGTLVGAYTTSGRLVAEVAVVWDVHAMYYLLSARNKSAHSGSVSLLLWIAIQEALARGVTFDFDGIASSSVLQFLSSFGGRLAQRTTVERLKLAYSAARQLKYASDYVCRSVHGVIGSS